MTAGLSRLLAVPTSRLLPQHAWHRARPWRPSQKAFGPVRSARGLFWDRKGFPSLVQTSSDLKSEGLPCPVWDGTSGQGCPALPAPLQSPAVIVTCGRTPGQPGDSSPCPGERGWRKGAWWPTGNPQWHLLHLLPGTSQRRDLPCPAQTRGALMHFNGNSGGGTCEGFLNYLFFCQSKNWGRGRVGKGGGDFGRGIAGQQVLLGKPPASVGMVEG